MKNWCLVEMVMVSSMFLFLFLCHLMNVLFHLLPTHYYPCKESLSLIYLDSTPLILFKYSRNIYLMESHLLPGTHGFKEIIYPQIKEWLVLFHNISWPILVLLFNWTAIFWRLFEVEPIYDGPVNNIITTNTYFSKITNRFVHCWPHLEDIDMYWPCVGKESSL